MAMTIEQQRALALAQARLRAQQPAGNTPIPPRPDPMRPDPMPVKPDEWRRGQLAPVERNEQTGELRLAVPQLALDAWDAITAPKRALDGEMNPVIDPETYRVNPYPNEMVGSALNMAGLATLTTPAARALGAPVGGARAAVPTVQQLKEQAGVLYGVAERDGITAPRASTITLADKAYAIAQREGLVSPTGRLDSSYPRIVEAIRTLDDYSMGEMTVPQMASVRRKLTDAVSSNEPGERRIAMALLDELDGMTAPLAPSLAQARALYTRAKKGELIDTAVELAGSRAGQFSGSGFENALRAEFRALERRIINGDLPGISAEERAAIFKVNRGGPVANALRFIGRFAPTGPVSLGMTGGVPFAVGNAFGGPATGAAAAGGSMLTAMLARAAATAATKRSALNAGETMRAGPLRQQVFNATLQDSVRRPLGLFGPAAIYANESRDQPMPKIPLPFV